MKKGFTLIELLVVVLIIGILSSIALPQYNKSVAKARTTEALQFGKAWAKAQNVYYLENGHYTSDLNELSIGMPELKYFSLGSGGYGGAIMLHANGYDLSIGSISFTIGCGYGGTLWVNCGGDHNACRNVMPCGGETGCAM